MPIVRFSENSHNIMGTMGAQNKEQMDKIDVEDYWAKWLDFKEQHKIKMMDNNVEALVGSSVRSESASAPRSLELGKSYSAVGLNK